MSWYGILGVLFRPLGWLRAPEHHRDEALLRELVRRGGDPALLPVARLAARMLPGANDFELLAAARLACRKLGFDNNVHILRAVAAAKAVAGRRE